MKDPIWDVLRLQERTLAWLARRTGYSHGYIRQRKISSKPPAPEFRRRCAEALGMPERSLFFFTDFDSRIVTSIRELAEVAV